MHTQDIRSYTPKDQIESTTGLSTCISIVCGSLRFGEIDSLGCVSVKEVESIRCRQATEIYIAGPHAGTAVIHFDGNGREGGMAMCGTAI